MPILAFLHKNIDSFPVIKVGATDEERERVKNFHNTVKDAGRLVDFYSNEDELKQAYRSRNILRLLIQ